MVRRLRRKLAFWRAVRFLGTIAAILVVFALCMVPAFFTTGKGALLVELGVLLVGVTVLQIVTGTASLGAFSGASGTRGAPDYDRRRRPGMFWFVVGAWCLLALAMTGLGICSLVAPHLCPVG